MHLPGVDTPYARGPGLHSCLHAAFSAPRGPTCPAPTWETILRTSPAAGAIGLFASYLTKQEESVPLLPSFFPAFQGQSQGGTDTELYGSLFPQSASTSTSKPTQGPTWRGGRCSSCPSTSGPSGRRRSCSRRCRRASTVPTSRSWSSPWSSRATVARWCLVRPWGRFLRRATASLERKAVILRLGGQWL